MITSCKHPVLKKKDPVDCLFAISNRILKYPLLIERLLKASPTDKDELLEVVGHLKVKIKLLN